MVQAQRSAIESSSFKHEVSYSVLRASSLLLPVKTNRISNIFFMEHAICYYSAFKVHM